jgi:hypothetical protein
MADAGVTARAQDALLDAFTLLVDITPGCERIDRPGVLAFSTGLRIPMCNQALIHTTGADPAATGGELVSFFDERAVPFLVQTARGRTDDAAGAARRASR